MVMMVFPSFAHYSRHAVEMSTEFCASLLCALMCYCDLGVFLRSQIQVAPPGTLFGVTFPVLLRKVLFRLPDTAEKD